MKFQPYVTEHIYDEMFESNEKCRSHYAMFKEKIEDLSTRKLMQLQHSTDKAQRAIGMTFNVYHDKKGTEKILPLDIIPRVINGKDWEVIEKGLAQRIEALNLFLQDIYNDGKILKDKVVPKELILSSQDYLDPCSGITPPKGRWCHITGTDLVRDGKGDFYVLEDNLRCPSGVSYMLENREILKRAFPQLLSSMGVRPVSDYPIKLLHLLQFLSDKAKPTVVVLTPGIFNSAYFEHSYLANEMGVTLVTGQDLIVENDFVFMQTTKGLQQVDVIYRRIDDKFMDPLAFRKDSMLGTPGLFNAYTKGNVALANAPGTGVADDKAVYAYVPRIIKYYLGEDPIIENVPTYLCREEKDKKYVLENIENLVVKETNAAGGYGMLIGPKASKSEHEKFKKLVSSNPNNYIAQPTLSLSTVPTISKSKIDGRHVDLRPYVLYGEKVEVIPGALTRVALKKGSLVVNSSQGGGSEDTWVLYN